MFEDEYEDYIEEEDFDDEDFDNSEFFEEDEDDEEENDPAEELKDMLLEAGFVVNYIPVIEIDEGVHLPPELTITKDGWEFDLSDAVFLTLQ